MQAKSEGLREIDTSHTLHSWDFQTALSDESLHGIHTLEGISESSGASMSSSIAHAILSDQCVYLPPPPNPAMLRSTRILSDTEIQQARLILKEEETVLIILEQQFSGCSKEISDDIKARLQQNIYGRRSMISAMRRLPVEILEEIFLSFCGASEYNLTVAEYGNEARPLVLSAVCLKWRTIAFDYPKLWSAVDVDLEQLTAPSFHILEIFLARSTGWPLSLCIRGLGRKMIPPPTLPGHDPWHTLVSNFHRCSKLVLDDEGWIIHLKIPEDIQVSFPILTTFDANYVRCELHSSLSPALARAPQLTSISTMITFPDLPYSQLTSLTIYNPSQVNLSHTFSILPLFTQLEYLAFCSVYVAPIGLPSVHLPTLKTLIVGGYDANVFTDPNYLYTDYMNGMFGPLSLPSLTTFKVAFQAPYDGQWPRGFVEFLGHASAITDLHISLIRYKAHRWTPPPISEILAQTPKLKYFHAAILCQEENPHQQEAYISKLILDLLDSLSKETCRLAPDLETLTFSVLANKLNAGFLDIVEAAIKVADLRQPGIWDVNGYGLPLKYIRIGPLFPNLAPSEPDVPVALARQIEELKENGVVVEVKQ